MSTNIKTPKKLIEVALPLDDINEASGYEKSVKVGKPTSLHLWWARRPLASARAVLFSQLVNDPGGQRGWTSTKTKAQAEKEREELFQILRDLVKWENTNNHEVIEKANRAIDKSWKETCELNRGIPGFDPDKKLTIHDPFSGGGAIPLEAQRLGLYAKATDLNPVAIALNKALIEVLPRFSGAGPVGPIPEEEKQQSLNDWSGIEGFREDVKRYGILVQNKAQEILREVYPEITIDDDLANYNARYKKYKGRTLTVISHIWARTVESPSPAFSGKRVPLVRSFVLSSKKNKEAWVQPVIDGDSYRFEIVFNKESDSFIEKTIERSGGKCILSGAPIPFSYIRKQGKQGKIGYKLMALVVAGDRERLFLPPIQCFEEIANNCTPNSPPNTPLPDKGLGFRIQEYGMTNHKDLYTPRQLLAMETFADIINETKDLIHDDALSAGYKGDNIGINDNGSGAIAYAEAICVFLSLAYSRLADWSCSLARWLPHLEKTQQLFARHAIPMGWDFSELNPISNTGGSFIAGVTNIVRSLPANPANLSTSISGIASQADAQSASTYSENTVFCTDPPYYDNIGYADLSDVFYVWLRKTLRSIYPDTFSTMVVPKAEELIADPSRHGGKKGADKFFLNHMTETLNKLRDYSNKAFPVTIYYAFKQSETKATGTASTGWEVFLEAVIAAGFSISGTWPVRTEHSSRLRGNNSNALATSVVLVCRYRETNALSISRRDFQKELRIEMPVALEVMIGGDAGISPIAPVDLAQSAIGPGMAIFSKYEKVLNQDGSCMSVHDALILINRAITDYLNPESENSDADTQFCSSWFDQYGWSVGPFGEADTLSRAKGTTVDGVKDAGVIESGQGKVRLLKWQEYPADWDPKQDNRTPIWEAMHHLIRTINQQGESGAGALLSRMPERGEPIRQLAYHLYTLCERKGWAEEARAYNELIAAWHAIVAASHDAGHIGSQTELEI